MKHDPYIYISTGEENKKSELGKDLIWPFSQSMVYKRGQSGQNLELFFSLQNFCLKCSWVLKFYGTKSSGA